MVVMGGFLLMVQLSTCRQYIDDNTVEGKHYYLSDYFSPDQITSTVLYDYR